MDQDARDMLIRIDQRTLNIEQKIDGDNGLVHRLNAHGDKIRKLEHFRFWAAGIAAGCLALFKFGKGD